MLCTGGLDYIWWACTIIPSDNRIRSLSEMIRDRRASERLEQLYVTQANIESMGGQAQPPPCGFAQLESGIWQMSHNTEAKQGSTANQTIPSTRVSANSAGCGHKEEAWPYLQAP